MLGLVPGIHVFNCQAKKVVDGGDKPALTKPVCTAVDERGPSLTQSPRAPKPAPRFLVATPDGKPVPTFPGVALIAGVPDGHSRRRSGRNHSPPLCQGSSQGVRGACRAAGGGEEGALR